MVMPPERYKDWRASVWAGRKAGGLQTSCAPMGQDILVPRYSRDCIFPTFPFLHLQHDFITRYIGY